MVNTPALNMQGYQQSPFSLVSQYLFSSADNATSYGSARVALVGRAAVQSGKTKIMRVGEPTMQSQHSSTTAMTNHTVTTRNTSAGSRHQAGATPDRRNRHRRDTHPTAAISLGVWPEVYTSLRF